MSQSFRTVVPGSRASPDSEPVNRQVDTSTILVPNPKTRVRVEGDGTNPTTTCRRSGEALRPPYQPSRSGDDHGDTSRTECGHGRRGVLAGPLTLGTPTSPTQRPGTVTAVLVTIRSQTRAGVQGGLEVPRTESLLPCRGTHPSSGDTTWSWSSSSRSFVLPREYGGRGAFPTGVKGVETTT